eukprot:gene22505-34443_t
MADRAGQAYAWPVPSDAGLSPPYGFLLRLQQTLIMRREAVTSQSTRFDA